MNIQKSGKKRYKQKDLATAYLKSQQHASWSSCDIYQLKVNGQI